jgi:outer membrane protein insertion porin family
VEVNTSRFNQNLVISTTNPYYTQNGISRTLDIFHRTTRPFFGNLNSYRIINTGVGTRFGVPVTETDTVFLGVNFEQTQVKEGVGIQMPNLLRPYIDKQTALPLTVGWARDRRDSALVPTRGVLQRFNSDLSIAGDSHYARATYQFQQYIPLTKKYTLAFNGDVGWGEGLKGREYPLLKNFYVGGLGSVRGFERNTLGPPPSQSGNSAAFFPGGPKKLVFNAEFITPFPGAGNDKTLRLFGFTDAGRAFGANESVSLDQLRVSAGIGLSWISPMGPLRFSYATPIVKQTGDRIQPLQFQIGTSF